MSAEKLLSPNDLPPVSTQSLEGRSPFLLVCDHAGRHLPATHGTLGLAASELDRHIAYDIGIAATSRRLSRGLDAALIEQRYSRLLVDCNRPPTAPSSIPAISETTCIPGNLNVSAAERERRLAEIFRPYHERIAAEIDRRLADGRRTVLIAMHSFTPAYKGVARPWHIGTLYGRDGRLAKALYALLVGEGRYTVGDNEPYAVSDLTDYSIPVHGEQRGLVHVGIEIRQDLITRPEGQAEWADILTRLLPQALDALQVAPAQPGPGLRSNPPAPAPGVAIVDEPNST
jgi:predicted N-formylglutamate amidohydrolase